MQPGTCRPRFVTSFLPTNPENRLAGTAGKSYTYDGLANGEGSRAVTLYWWYMGRQLTGVGRQLEGLMCFNGQKSGASRRPNAVSILFLCRASGIDEVALNITGTALEETSITISYGGGAVAHRPTTTCSPQRNATRKAGG